MPKKVIFLISLLVFIFIFTHSVNAYLVCTSPKKGVSGGKDSWKVGAAYYNYIPYSENLNNTPMLKREYIRELRRQPDSADSNCTTEGCLLDTKTTDWGFEPCCPAKEIENTIMARGPGGYWLIFNEPMVQDEYNADFGQTSGRVAADDAAFAISTIKAIEEAHSTPDSPDAQFIVGWLYYKWFSNGVLNERTIASEWASVIAAHPEYHLSSNINDVIAGWSVHYVDATTLANANDPAWPRSVSPNREIWVTEFGPQGAPDANHCQYPYLTNSASANTCIAYMQNQVYAMENSPFITKYFWWNLSSCDPSHPNYIGCYGPLFVDNSINRLGEAFAAIPNDNDVCRYSQTTPTPLPTATTIPPNPYNLDNDPQGLVNDADLQILLDRWPALTFSATGGTITYSNDYTIHTFTSNGTFTPNGPGIVEYLVVAGGGSGSGGENSTGNGGGGGGGGGGILNNPSYGVSNQSYSVVVGTGGNSSTVTNGGNSSFGTIIAVGGGAGGAGNNGASNPGANGGSGGGGGRAGAGGSATTGQGNTGGTSSGPLGGGGGGKGNAASGQTAGTGINYYGTIYGAGGTGGNYDTGGSGTSGGANTGMGGSGGDSGGTGGTGGAGGSGIIIVRYPTRLGDFNQDNKTNETDLTMLLANWQPNAPTPTPTSTPRPTATPTPTPLPTPSPTPIPVGCNAHGGVCCGDNYAFCVNRLISPWTGGVRNDSGGCGYDKWCCTRCQ